MKKIKRISALIGALLLAVLYLCTLIFALIDSPLAYDLFKASVGATILLPVVLYAMILTAKLLKNKDSEHKK